MDSVELVEPPDPVLADYESTRVTTDWRRNVRWPVAVAEFNTIAASQTGRALEWAAGLESQLERDAALLALPYILAYGRAIILCALAASRAEKTGLRLVGASPELRYLCTGVGPVPSRNELIQKEERIGHELARRIARIGSWARPAQVLHALLAPDAVAVSHNPLLCAAAAGGGTAVGFRHAVSLLGTARRHLESAPAMADHAAELARIIGASIADEPYRGRAIDILGAVMRSHLEGAARDMAALRSVRLPEHIWSGSGGRYAPRAVGLEVMRRGGKVTRFDHGTPKGFIKSREFNSLIEFAVSSEFVVATQGAAEICRGHGACKDIAKLRQARTTGANGDPLFARTKPMPSRPSNGGRPRVVYAPTVLVGFRQLLPPQPIDVVYLDWQFRVAEALRDLPIDLVCQPHPEGLLKGLPHPLEGVATTIRGNFAAQFAVADVFIFDYPSTTALWETACTDARIVYLDIGSGVMTPPVSKLFTERATVIPVAFDDHNRPLLDAEALRVAVLGPSRPANFAPLRNLLAGSA